MVEIVKITGAFFSTAEKDGTPTSEKKTGTPPTG